MPFQNPWEIPTMRKLDQSPPVYVTHPPTTANLKNSSIAQAAISSMIPRPIFLSGLTVVSRPGTVSESSKAGTSIP